MTVGQISGLIAAIAFALLVIGLIYLIINLVRTLRVVTKHVDSIGVESNKVLGHADDLLVDVTSKSARIDPAMQAIGDLGTTVSDITTKTKKGNAKRAAEKPSLIDEAMSLFGIAVDSGIALEIGKQFASFAGKHHKKRSKKRRSTKTTTSSAVATAVEDQDV